MNTIWPDGAKIDLGCGQHKLEGYFGVDIEQFPGVDHVYDLRNGPYPAGDNTINAIYAHHTFEHFSWDEVVFLMNECWRILKPHKEIDIIVPLFPSEGAIDDPSHKTFFGKESFGRFEPENEFAYESKIINKWRRKLNNWTPEIEVTETSRGMNWLFPTRRELHVILERLP